MGYLFTWKEENWRWSNLDNDLRRFAKGGTIELRWSSGNRRKMEIGDDAFLIRLGTSPTGIFAFGKVSSIPTEREHYDAEKGKGNETILQFTIALSAFTDPRSVPFVPLGELQSTFPRRDNWTPQSSGMFIEAAICDSLAGRIQRAQQDRQERQFGEIRDVPVGSSFPSRKALAEAGVHRPTVAGISGSARDGADSIVISGGYEDDEDYGTYLTYTGAGGNDPNTGRQIKDQELKGTNLALAKSFSEGLPIRVTRGADSSNPHAPENGYRYDGIYRVTAFWHAAGKSGHRIYRFRLDQETEAVAAKISSDAPVGSAQPKRTESVTKRVVRDTRVARYVKQLHEHTCQICAIRIPSIAGFYSEGAHIRPLGSPHNGPDVTENILCLCPNHHVMFDDGVFSIKEDFSIIGDPACNASRLISRPSHSIDSEHLNYHRHHIYRG